MLINFYCNT